MNDKKKFKDLTKPLSFRSARKILSRLKLIRESLTYHFYNLLCKLKLLKRYSYRDSIVNHIGILSYNEKIIHLNLIADLEVRVEEVNYISDDYFYRDTKQGKKIVYTLENECHTDTHLIGILKNVGIRVNGQEHFLYTTLPILRVPCQDNGFSEYRIDLNRILSLSNKKVLSYRYDEMSESEKKYFYEVILEEYRSYFKEFNINSIMVLVKNYN